MMMVTLAMLIPVGLGVGCCVYQGRSAAISAAAMTAMLAGMTDVMLLGGALLPQQAWAGLFCALAAVEMIAAHEFRLRVRRAGQAVVMAALTATMPPMGSHLDAVHQHGGPMTGSMDAAAVGPPMAADAVTALVLAFVYLTYLVREAGAEQVVVLRFELVAGFLAVAGMLLMVFH
jgi:hypothetical protein